MLLSQGAIHFSDYSSLYDIVVPKNNKLRLINELVDFSFIYEELNGKYCQDNGRMAEWQLVLVVQSYIPLNQTDSRTLSNAYIDSYPMSNITSLPPFVCHHNLFCSKL